MKSKLMKEMLRKERERERYNKSKVTQFKRALVRKELQMLHLEHEQ